MSRFCVFRPERLPTCIIRTAHSGSSIKDGITPIDAGDAFIFKPGEPHQITNDTAEDMLVYVVADNPMSDTYHHPDSHKWGVPFPERTYVSSEGLDYFDGEE